MSSLTATKTDPLAAFIAGAFAQDRSPIPLVSTRLDVEILGGLAVVETVRTFRNAEDQTIEASITFPVPVQAALYRLQATVDGRRLTATAKARPAAREIYESAIERGKAAVLHEEVLKGVHTLSVAHIAPGAEIEIATTWVVSLSLVGAEARLRIPLTVGDIYGRSGLNEADELITGGPTAMARLSVRSDQGAVQVAGVTMIEGAADVPLNAPIDLTIPKWSQRELVGEAADGRAVRLFAEPAPRGDETLNVAILVDHSSSMSSVADATASRQISTHQAAVAALSKYECRSQDYIDLWEFDDSAKRIGDTRDTSLSALAAQLEEPRGGTEIGGALQAVLATSSARDILLITDGNSYSLDVHQLAASGRRISVILVGEDSLDAKVGHLAALTGGDVWVAAGFDLRAVMQAGVDSLRRASRRQPRRETALEEIMITRSGLTLRATWSDVVDSDAGGAIHPGVAAFAASLMMFELEEERAALLAEAEGLVTHLTSLVLVDEASTAQEAIPLLRKVALPSPRAASASFSAAASFAPSSSDSMQWVCSSSPAPTGRFDCADSFPPPRPRLLTRSPIPPIAVPPKSKIDEFRNVAAGIDWGKRANDLVKGDLSRLTPLDAQIIKAWSLEPAIQNEAKSSGGDPLRLVIALLAVLAGTNRHAKRVASRLASQPQIARLFAALGGATPAP